MVGAIIEIWFAEVRCMIKSVEIGLFKRAMISDIGADSVIEAKWNQNGGLTISGSTDISKKEVIANLFRMQVQTYD